MPAGGQPPVPTNTFATLTYRAGAWRDPVTWCPATAAAAPRPDPAAVRAEAERLLPRVAIGSAWSSRALVNTETILWAQTAARRTLPAVTLLGQPVTISVTAVEARWDFGDGARAVTSSLGRAYDERADPCRTAQCPRYYGHTYTRTGQLTIVLTVAWQASFRVGGGWQRIPGPITGPATTRPLTVVQSRAVITH